MKILLVDDHPLFREGLALMLTQQFSTAAVLEAGDVSTALHLVDTHADLALVLLDLNLNGTTGSDALLTLRQRAPTLPVVIVSASESRTDVMACLRAGARGYVPKSEAPTVFRSALRLVLDGGVYIPPVALTSSERTKHDDDDTVQRRSGPSFTTRERKILALLCEGTSNKGIAQLLQISEGTVHTHLKSIFRELGVNNRTQAAMAARQLGIDRPDARP
ncbi:MAG: response regulator transcription factor [Burkholderiales bacterium]|nr:response regulator transcription factor [Burkholderiales bacterium]